MKSTYERAELVWGRDEKNGVIFHDFRRTFITDMQRAGVRRSVSMSITGKAEETCTTDIRK